MGKLILNKRAVVIGNINQMPKLIAARNIKLFIGGVFNKNLQSIVVDNMRE